MAGPLPDQEMAPLGRQRFATTHWSVVLAAVEQPEPEAQQALETLCRAYWYPLYAYVRRTGHSPVEAQDLTQEFFARFLAKNYLARADPTRGRFRTFLLTALKHFLVNEWERETRQKRGGGCVLLSLEATTAEGRYAAEPVDSASPDRIYEKRWALALLERAFERLTAEYAVAGRTQLLEELKQSVWGEQDRVSYAELAARLGLTEVAVKVNVHRLRRRFGELLRAEVAHTVARPEEIAEELRYLIGVMSS